MSIFDSLFNQGGVADAAKVYLPKKEAKDFHGKLWGELSFDSLLTKNRAEYPALHPDRLFFIADFNDIRVEHEECDDTEFVGVYVLSHETRYRMTFGGGYVQAPTPTSPGVLISFAHTYWDDLINWYLWYIENQVAPLRKMEKAASPDKGYEYWARKRYLEFNGFSVPGGPDGLVPFRLRENDPIIGTITFERTKVPLHEIKALFWSSRYEFVCSGCVTESMFREVWEERRSE